MECGICHEKEPELLQEHHWRYKPEIKSILYIFCHSVQHLNHGIGRGLISKRDMKVLLYFILKKQKEIISRDIYKFYSGQTFRKLKLFGDMGLLKRKEFTEFPKIYEINPSLNNKIKIKLEQEGK
jgi:hypothetical protein